MLCSVWGSPGALDQDQDFYWPAQFCSVLWPYNLELTSISSSSARTVDIFIQTVIIQIILDKVHD